MRELRDAVDQAIERSDNRNSTGYAIGLISVAAAIIVFIKDLINTENLPENNTVEAGGSIADH